MPPGPPPAGNSWMLPPGVTTPIWFALYSLNHMSPSGPSAICHGWEPAVGVANSLITPLPEMTPTLLVPISVNHIPPGPAAMPVSSAPALGSAYSWNLCVRTAKRPILFPSSSATQSVSCGPAAIATGYEPLVGIGYSVTRCVFGSSRAIASAFTSVNQSAPSGPSVIQYGPALGVGSGYSVNLWVRGAKRPILFAAVSVNHIDPSGPSVIERRPAFA